MENNKRDYRQEKTSNSNSLKFNINGKQVSDKFTIFNASNNYFVEIGPQLESSINTTINPLTCVKSSSNSMCMPYVEEHEILEIVYQLKESSPGWYQFPPLRQRPPFNLTLNL